MSAFRLVHPPLRSSPPTCHFLIPPPDIPHLRRLRRYAYRAGLHRRLLHPPYFPSISPNSRPRSNLHPRPWHLPHHFRNFPSRPLSPQQTPLGTALFPSNHNRIPHVLPVALAWSLLGSPSPRQSRRRKRTMGPLGTVRGETAVAVDRRHADRAVNLHH